MTPDDRQAMVAAWKVIHKGVRPDCFPSVTHTAEKMFAAGLLHARELVAAQLEARAAEVAQCDCTQCSNTAAELREQAAKIRSGE